MKRTALFLLTLLLTLTAAAQVDNDAMKRQQEQMRKRFNSEKDKLKQQYDKGRRKAEEDFATFRKKANAEFAEALLKPWTMMSVEPAVPKPKEPAPPQPSKPQNVEMTKSTPLPKSEVVTKVVDTKPLELPPVAEPAPSIPTMQVPFYGTTCSLHADAGDLRFKLASIDEKNVSEAWKKLSQDKYDGLLHDCIAQRDALLLSDWGYLRLIGNSCEKLLGKGSNEAVLLQMYLLAQSGYRVRIARMGDKLVLLVPFNRSIYNYSAVILDGIKHYVLISQKSGKLQVCNVVFPREKVANILMGHLPNLGVSAKRSRTLQSEKFGTMKATVSVNQRLIDYLNDYPLRDAWEYYALAGLSDSVKSVLYPALRSQIEGKSKKKAANMLLDFVQTAFDYATDHDQFGYERPLFADESIFFPKNDCEDRSIFFAILVRDLLGLDVVLVHWPGHLATAVAFTDEVEGDYFTIDGRRYTICDPTYIGASVGMTMPQFKNVDAKLVKL